MKLDRFGLDILQLDIDYKKFGLFGPDIPLHCTGCMKFGLFGPDIPLRCKQYKTQSHLRTHLH